MGRRSEKIRIIGVDCPTCVLAIEKELKKLPGVELSADVTTGEAVVSFDERVTLWQIVKAIRDAGYDVEKEHLYLQVDISEEEGGAFEASLAELPGVIQARYSPVTNMASILFNPRTVTREKLLERVKSLFPEIREIEGEREQEEERDEKIPKLVSFILGLGAILYHTSGVFGIHPPLWQYGNYILFLIASIVIALNIDTMRRGFRSLLRRAPTMDSLVSLSVSSIFLYSVWAMLSNSPDVYFEAAAGVMGFISFGRYLEERLRKRSTQSLAELMSKMVDNARVLRGGRVVEVKVEDVREGELVEVREGERVPVDGVVVEGKGYVDESLFTGEPMPKPKDGERRDVVLAGSTLVQGYLLVRVTRAGGETNLAYVIRAVKEAQFYKPEIQRLADLVVGRLTWAVILLSLLTFSYWYFVRDVSVAKALLFSVAVLVVTCPCPLGIAVPMVISLSSVKALRMGVLVRRGDLFERLLGVKVLMLDKTGTLTIGSPKVISSRTFGNREEDISLICSAERRSEHPIGKAIVRYCEERGISFEEPSSFESFPGLGVLARVKGREVAVGSKKMAELLGARVEGIEEVLEEVSRRGNTAVLGIVEREVVFLIEVGDEIRKESQEFVKGIRRAGIEPVLATGDSYATAKVVAEKLGIEEVYAELTPEDKAELVEKMGSKGVAFIGDGINDAIAIGKSSVGIAMGRGADISKEAGDVVVLNNNLLSVLDLFSLAKVVRRKALENFWWAFLYNVALIPVAAGILFDRGIYLTPELAAIAMILSDISVILNSFTVLAWRPTSASLEGHA
ncbi:MAG: cation-translocating P-type ATPase [Acidilobaceae archaeon]|nr:cation-translocating P-type ATPase [Acidilobaceae archaeon]MCX8165902.1 cation-translocating P-type ATPase [Acidilobaceae archaeon]MDW7974544.1 cation-translocating P-type ATPase [Sulfolobales archaeon]